MTLKVTTSGASAEAVKTFIGELVSDRVASRIAAKDSTLWGKAAEAEASIRLGWVSSAKDSQRLVQEVLDLRRDLVASGITRVVLCGMGGSSLAPEVITETEGASLVVLDSTNPEQVRKVIEQDIAKTVVVVSSKSGSTVETDSQKRVFEGAFEQAGIQKTERIIIVTDPGSPMEQAAKSDGYRVFNADPTVGGRYSALTAFGLVPSGLAGADIAKLLHDADSAAQSLSIDSEDNPGLQLGAAMARTLNGEHFKDKLGLIADQSLVGFGDWAEQLIAESTGKDQKGILPVVLTENSHEIGGSTPDLLVARISKGEGSSGSEDLMVSGSLGEQFVLWEFATVVASRLIGINPFDQPDVESAKVAARGLLESREPLSEPAFEDEGIQVRAGALDLGGVYDIPTAVEKLLTAVSNDGYVSIQAYLDRTTEFPILELRELIAKRTNRPTTFGWAPRFLHSTGQYHKGGPLNGVFLQLVSNTTNDLKIPGRNFTFGELIASQASGDAKVLSELKRPVLTLSFNDVEAAISVIKNAI